MPKLTYTAPPPSLMRELREVAIDAGALAAELTKANRLPEVFPAEQLQELLVELQSVVAGTAEGCRQPLEYARARLPAIRRQFIQTEEQSLQPHTDVDAPPPLTRGMTIDLRLGALISSVTTALDEYRALASVQEDDPADTSPSIEIDPNAPDAVAAMAAARNAEQALGASIGEFERIVERNSVTAEDLKRQIHDAQGLLSLARIELGMPAFVPRWYRKTVDAISDYPRILRGTVRAMRMGVDVARPLVDAWHRYEKGFTGLILESIEQAASGLSAVAQKWEVERTGKRRTVTVGDIDEPPSDFDLGAARTMILRGETPPPSWRPWIKELDFFEQELRGLEPLAALTALKDLDLSSTQVRDLSPLAALSGLENLYLNGTQVSDLSPLAALTALQNLDLEGSQVSDLSPLLALATLQHLYLNGTRVNDLSPLVALTGLQNLYLNNTQVTDLSPLAGLTALRRLELDGTRVTDLSPLAAISGLEYLDLDGSQVSDLLPLAGLTALQY